MKNEIHIIGAGTYGEVMHELAEICGYSIAGFFDDDDNKLNKQIVNSKVIGKFSDLKENELKGKKFIIAIGDNKIRFEYMNKIIGCGGETPTIIHPTAVISPSAEIGKSVYIQAQAHIWTKAKICDCCIISPSTVIAHHSIIGKACLISTLTCVGASINVGENVTVGIGASLVTGLRNIGRDSIIGAGSVVLKDTEASCVYGGVPAQKIKSVKP